MKRFAAAAALCAAVSAGAVEPVENLEDIAVSARGGVPAPEQVRDAIVAAGKRGQWDFEDDGPGRLVGTRRVRDRHEISVTVTYSESRYSITYRDSLNMSYRAGEGTIHANYNRWVRDLRNSINAALRRIDVDRRVARVAGAPAVVAPGGEALPQPGDTWTYRLREPKRRDGPAERSYVVTATEVSASEIVDQVAIDGSRAVASRHGRGTRLHAPAAGIFSPYLYVFQKPSGPAQLGAIEIDDPACRGPFACEVRGYVAGEEPISVAAGRFNATKIVIEQTWRPAFAASGAGAGTRILTVWYAPQVRRAVKYSSQLAYGASPPMETDFELELASYRVAPDPSRILAAPQPPQIGDNWTYRVSEAKKAKPRTMFVQVASVSPALIVEHVSLEGGFTMPWRHARGGYLVPQGVSVFSPYLPQFEKVVLGEAIGYIESADPGCRGLFVCQAQGTYAGEETVEVSAGRFRTLKVEIEQTWRPAAGASKDPKELARMHGSRSLTIWYSSDLKRAVKYQSRLTAGERLPIEADYDLELVSYEVK